jgi:hypothetical protein
MLNAKGFLHDCSLTTLRQSTHHRKHTTLKQNTAHKTTQTIKDTLHTVRKIKLIQTQEFLCSVLAVIAYLQIF